MADSDAKRTKRVEDVVRRAAKGRSVKAEVEHGRRASDLIKVTLNGQKVAVMVLPMKLLDALPDEDIELIDSSGDAQHYRLTLVVTKRLEHQKINAPERRAKLQNFLDKQFL